MKIAKFYSPLWGHSENSFLRWRYRIWREYLCRKKGHNFVRHYTGNYVQMCKEAPIGREVDFYYCERCGLKDPKRNEHSSDPDKQYRKSCYVNAYFFHPRRHPAAKTGGMGLYF